VVSIEIEVAAAAERLSQAGWPNPKFLKERIGEETAGQQLWS